MASVQSLALLVPMLCVTYALLRLNNEPHLTLLAPSYTGSSFTVHTYALDSQLSPE